MPIVEFSTPIQLGDWAENCTSPTRYLVYITAEKEIIIRPTKSTNTLDFGYFKAVTAETLKEVSAKLQEAGYAILEINAYHWDREKFGNGSGG